jgi:hypothetical protein
LLPRCTIIFALLVCHGVSACSAEPARVAERTAQAAMIEQKVVENEVLVKFHPDISDARARWVLSQIRGEVTGRIHSIRLYRVRVPHDTSMTQVISMLRGFAEVQYAEPDSMDRPDGPK